MCKYWHTARPCGFHSPVHACELGDKANTVTLLTDRTRTLSLGDIGTEPGPPSADGEDAANSIACLNQRQAK